MHDAPPIEDVAQALEAMGYAMPEDAIRAVISGRDHYQPVQGRTLGSVDRDKTSSGESVRAVIGRAIRQRRSMWQDPRGRV